MFIILMHEHVYSMFIQLVTIIVLLIFFLRKFLSYPKDMLDKEFMDNILSKGFVFLKYSFYVILFIGVLEIKLHLDNINFQVLVLLLYLQIRFQDLIHLKHEQAAYVTTHIIICEYQTEGEMQYHSAIWEPNQKIHMQSQFLAYMKVHHELFLKCTYHLYILLIYLIINLFLLAQSLVIYIQTCHYS